MTRFVVCGEALIDLIPAGPSSTTASSTWYAYSAGGPMNSAAALGKLGVDVQFLGRFSTDAFGGQLRSHIAASGVKLDLATDSSQATSIAVVSLDERGVARYTFHFNETANFGWQADDLPRLGPQDWLHIASLATVVSPGAETLLDWASTLTCGVSFDVNVRPTVITDPDRYWARVRPWLRVVGVRGGIAKASDEDIAFLARSSAVSPTGATDPVEVAGRWVDEYGLRMAIVTLGPDGAVAVRRGGEHVRVDGFPTTVVDTVGAGDTFMAGFLDGHINRGLPLADSLRRGAAAASIVCSRQGAQPPTTAELERLLASAAATA